MKILITQDTDWIKRNPGQQHHLAERLSLRGHEIRVIDYEILWRTKGKKELVSKRQVFQNFSKIFPNSNVTVIRPRILKIPYLDYLSMFLTYSKEIKKQISKFKPDIIIGHSIVTNYLSMRYAKKYGIPFVFHMTDAQHTIIPSKMLQAIGKSIEHKILQNADRVVVINELLKEYAVKMGADEDKVSIIKAGIESEKYDPSIENTDLKVKYGINDTDFVLFFMGWLYNFSGLQEVIKELAKVKDKYSNLKLMIVGDGDAYDELKKLVGEYELFDRVILTGKQSFEEIPKFISISTVCILPAHLNNTMRNIVPIKMYEYMAMKNPVLVTKLPGVMKEFGENNGVIYVDKPEDVIETALKLDLNEEGNKARNFVEGNDWEKITDEFENFLGGLIEKTSQNLKFEDYLIIDPICDEFKGKNIDLDNLPRVSFCIPTFNSSRTLERCLKSIVEQKYHDIEIIIVDNGSGDNTVEIAKKYTDKIYFDDGLLGSVRQTSLEKATGNVIALFDSDIIIPHKNWLFNSVIYFNYSDSVSTVWPENIAPPNSPWTTRLYFNLWKMSMNDRAKKGKSVFGGGNALFLRNCLDEIGGINKNIHWGEDFEWAQNLRSHGYQVIATKDPLYHDTMHSMKEFRRKQFVASETFVKENINLMGLSKKDLIYENVMLGTKNMLYGIFLKKDFSWLLFPIFMFLRGLGFGFNYLKNTFEVKK